MTPITKNLKLQKAYSILFLLLPFLAMAQEDFTPDTDDLASNAPIDNYILLAMFIGIYFAYRFLKPTITPKQLNN